MWPLPPLLPASEVSAQLTLMFVASVIFVLAVFVLLLVRMRRRHRTIRVVTCPENDDRPALIVVDRSADGDTVTHCSQWHDRRLDCGARCLDQLAGS